LPAPAVLRGARLAPRGARRRGLPAEGHRLPAGGRGREGRPLLGRERTGPGGLAAVTRSAVVALDVGGTTIASGLGAADGTVLHSAARPCVVDGRRDPGLAGTVAAAREMVAAAAERGVDAVAIGAGFPEYVDAARRLTSREVLHWTAQPAGLLAPLLPGRPVVVDSDVRCAALAEAGFGRGRGLGSFLYVSLGT